jgi:hypothetical protein
MTVMSLDFGTAPPVMCGPFLFLITYLAQPTVGMLDSFNVLS